MIDLLETPGAPRAGTSSTTVPVPAHPDAFCYLLALRFLHLVRTSTRATRSLYDPCRPLIL
jgi:hypothetical protein